MKQETAMHAIELRDIMATELRELSKVTMEDKYSSKKIDKAKQIFNGAGKMIALSAWVTETTRIGMGSPILALPENTSKILDKDNKKK